MTPLVLDAAQLRDLLVRPIAFHRCFVDAAGGSVTAGLLLSQALYWQSTKEPDEWFYKIAKEWCKETGLSTEEFKTARRRLTDAGLLEYEVRGIPAKGYFRLNMNRLVASLGDSLKQDRANGRNQWSANTPASYPQSRKLLATENTHKKREVAWWRNNEDLLKKAQELGIPTRGESSESLARLIRSRL